MVRATKSTTPASTPVVSAAAPVVAEKASKKAAAPAEKSSKKTKETAAAPVAVAPVAVAPVAVAPVAPAAPVEAVEKASSESLLSVVDAKLQQIGALFASLKADSKALHRQIAQDKKAAEKAAKKSSKKKRAPVDGEAKPRNSGFMKPVRLSDELASFLGKNTGTVMGRQDANAEIRSYITANGLKETAKGKGRNINPDAKLSALLKVPSGEQLDYFNLQKYMKPHFIKIETVATA